MAHGTFRGETAIHGSYSVRKSTLGYALWHGPALRFKSLPVFGEGSGGAFVAWLAPLADPTRPRYRSAALPEAGEG